MKFSRPACHLLSALLSLATASAASPVEPLINQTGQLPTRPSGAVSMKFAIVLLGDLTASGVATAKVTAKRVSTLTLVDPGAGYLSAPLVTITGGGGSGAKAVATVANGRIATLTLTAPGNSYETPPTIVIAPPARRNAVTTLWSNDGTSAAGSEPKTAVSLAVVKGTFSAPLGLTSLPNMTALPHSIFAETEARLRIWYRTPLGVYAKVVSDAPLQADFFADESFYAQSAGSVAAGGVNAAAIADGTITAAKLVPGLLPVTGSSAGVLVASYSANDSQLAAQGYIRIQSFTAKSWTAGDAVNEPNGRVRHSAVWTGSKMIVWGGEVSGNPSAQGGEYSPDTNSWTVLPALNAPAARSGHSAVWTGSKMIVFGGNPDATAGASGGLYDPVEQAWVGLSTVAVPAGRSGHTAVWTGSKMIVWGGGNPGGLQAAGGLYTPPAVGDPAGSGGSWAVLPANGLGGVRRDHSAIWTGSRMIVWGGLDANGNALASGAAFNPTDLSWTALPTANAPAARAGQSVVWTGSKMIVFGGAKSDLPASATDLFFDGAVYDPTTNLWTPLSVTNAPDGRFHASAVWTGSEMIVLGGEALGGALLSSASAYNPALDSWRALTAAPGDAQRPSAVWSGQLLLGFGASGLISLDPTPALHFYGRF